MLTRVQVSPISVASADANDDDVEELDFATSSSADETQQSGRGDRVRNNAEEDVKEGDNEDEDHDEEHGDEDDDEGDDEGDDEDDDEDDDYPRTLVPTFQSKRGLAVDGATEGSGNKVRAFCPRRFP